LGAAEDADGTTSSSRTVPTTAGRDTSCTLASRAATRGDARRALDAILSDEPEWADSLYVGSVGLDERDVSAN
jgi:hypothetical protein